jgi:hypothetical protein
MDFEPFMMGLFAGLVGTWMGAAMYQVVITGPAMRDAGAAGQGFAHALARRRGTGLLFAVLAFATTLVGLATAAVTGVFRAPTEGAHAWIGLAVLFVLLALARGATANRVAEMRFLKAWLAVGTGPSANAKEVAVWGARAARANAITMATVAAAFLCLVVAQAVA